MSSPPTTSHDAKPAQAAMVSSVWRASQLGAAHEAQGVSSQFAVLDAELPGRGWPRRALVELMSDTFGIGELRLLLPVLTQSTRAGKPVMLIAPPALPYAPALAAGGVILEQLLLVQPHTERDILWTTEQALKSSSLDLVLAWLPEKRHCLPNNRLRRLQLAATESNSVCFVFRPMAACAQPSPAPMRLALVAAERGLVVTLVKRRGPPAASPIHIDIPALSSTCRHPPTREEVSSRINDLSVDASRVVVQVA